MIGISKAERVRRMLINQFKAITKARTDCNRRNETVQRLQSDFIQQQAKARSKAWNECWGCGGVSGTAQGAVGYSSRPKQDRRRGMNVGAVEEFQGLRKGQLDTAAGQSEIEGVE